MVRGRPNRPRTFTDFEAEAWAADVPKGASRLEVRVILQT